MHTGVVKVARIATGVAMVFAVGTLATVQQASAVVEVQPVPAQDETTPVTHAGDTADDPAIWVNPSDASESLVIGNDKGAGGPGALESYDLDGDLVQRITEPSGFWGNVDVRQGASLPAQVNGVVGVMRGGIRLYTVDAATRQLEPVGDDGGAIATSGEGFCFYHSSTSQVLYAFAVAQTGTVRQFQITDSDGDGLLDGHLVRTFEVGTEAESCVADDATGALYVSEEQIALWRYGAEPETGASRTQIDTVEASGGHLTPDIEGLTLTSGPDAGYLIASAQNVSDRQQSSFAVYQRTGSNDYVKSFRITDGSAADDCDGTDGIAAYAGSLGANYPQGLFVCQDNNNDIPGSSGYQDFKYADLGAILPTSTGNPVAAFDQSCSELACDFDGSGSADPGGQIVSYAWDFGDGATSTATSPSYTFIASDTYPVTLTVTDNDGATDTLTKQVQVSEAGTSAIGFVGANSTNGNRRTHSVQVPSGVADGDSLVLFMTTNTDRKTIDAPAGWTPLETVDENGMRARSWTRTATGGDAGETVTVATSGYTKADLTLAAFRADAGPVTVAASAHAFVRDQIVLATPPVTAAAPGSWLISYWGAKSGQTPWTVPAGQYKRAESDGTGGVRSAAS